MTYCRFTHLSPGSLVRVLFSSLSQIKAAGQKDPRRQLVALPSFKIRFKVEKESEDVVPLNLKSVYV